MVNGSIRTRIATENTATLAIGVSHVDARVRAEPQEAAHSQGRRAPPGPTAEPRQAAEAREPPGKRASLGPTVEKVKAVEGLEHLLGKGGRRSQRRNSSELGSVYRLFSLRRRLRRARSECHRFE